MTVAAKCNFSPLLSFGGEDVMVRRKGAFGRRRGQIRVRSLGTHHAAAAAGGWRESFEVNKYKISALLFWLLLLERGERGGGEGGG